MKRVLLVVDTPNRDLLGIAVVAYWLIHKHKAMPIIVGTRNEVVGLIKHRPHVILMPHVRYERNRCALQYAKAQGTTIAMLPVEGLANTPRLVPPGLGVVEFRAMVDLFFSWGTYIADRCRTEGLMPNATIQVTGCPRFDLHAAFYNSLFPSREEFCQKLGFTQGRPVVAWFSSVGSANLPGTDEEFVRDLKTRRGSQALVVNDIDLLALRYDDQRVYDTMMGMFERYVQEHPQFNYLVKPHPGEPYQPYRDRLSRYSNVKIVEPSFSVTEAIRHTDVQLNWRCTTSMEGWLNNFQKPTLSVVLPGLATSSSFEDLIQGNDQVESYSDMKDHLNRYLSGGSVTAQSLAGRRHFFEKHLHPQDGRAGEQVADLLMQHVEGRPEPRRTRGNYEFLLKEYSKQLFKTRQALYEKRGPEHYKHLSPARFQAYVDLMNKAFQTNIQLGQYVIES